jgi:hypothetical protein
MSEGWKPNGTFMGWRWTYICRIDHVGLLANTDTSAAIVCELQIHHAMTTLNHQQMPIGIKQYTPWR